VVIPLQKRGGISNRVVMTVIREWVKVGGNSITKRGSDVGNAVVMTLDEGGGVRSVVIGGKLSAVALVMQFVMHLSF
jgi:hypothetical protein